MMITSDRVATRPAVLREKDRRTAATLFDDGGNDPGCGTKGHLGEDLNVRGNHWRTSSIVTPNADTLDSILRGDKFPGTNG